MTATSKHYPGEPIGLPNWNGDDTLERAYPTWPTPRRNAPVGPAETPRAIAPASGGSARAEGGTGPGADRSARGQGIPRRYRGPGRSRMARSPACLRHQSRHIRRLLRDHRQFGPYRIGRPGRPRPSRGRRAPQHPDSQNHRNRDEHEYGRDRQASRGSRRQGPHDEEVHRDGGADRDAHGCADSHRHSDPRTDRHRDPAQSRALTLVVMIIAATPTQRTAGLPGHGNVDPDHRGRHRRGRAGARTPLRGQLRGTLGRPLQPLPAGE